MCTPPLCEVCNFVADYVRRTTGDVYQNTSYSGWENTPGVNFADWNNFSSGNQFSAFVSYIDPGGSSGGGGGDPNPTFWEGVKSFFRNLFGGKKNNTTKSDILPLAGVVRTVEVGEIEYLGRAALTWEEISAAVGSLRGGVWALPLILKGDTPKPKDEITLYRGVYVGHPDYANALKGTAVPRGGDANPIEHNDGNNESIYTSWSIYIEVADKFGGRKGVGGLVLTKTFPLWQVVPSPDKFQQGEVLIPGIVTGAIVTPATPNPKKVK